MIQRHPGTAMCAKAFTILAAFAAVTLPAPAGGEIVGPASVVDGDTLEIEGQKVRLYGVDAPEAEQTCAARTEWRCGAEAARALTQKITGHPVTCAERGNAADGAVLATCRLGAEDLAAWLAQEGWALAWRAQSSDYLGEEQDARAARRGVWRGALQAPWDWRAAQMARARAKGRTQNERLILAAMPADADASAPRNVTIRAASNGHFYVEAVANGRRIPLVVDTGATVVSLTRQDAERIGLDVSHLSYTQRVQTANGVARAAPVTLREVSIGPVAVADVEAVVNEGRSAHSLLGMSFLSRLQGYSVSGDSLTMTAP
jgi:clan AA aspartic protease (TIGR02281 family)